MTIDELDVEVTDAIWRAEHSDGEEAVALWAEVSRIEEQLSSVLPRLSHQWFVAMRGAFAAAVKAEDLDRAIRLAKLIP